MAYINDPEIGNTYEWDVFTFPILIQPGSPPDPNTGTTTGGDTSINVLKIEELPSSANINLEYTLGETPSISGYFDSVFDQTEIDSFRQESEFKNVYTRVSKFNDIPENDTHIIKFKVDPRREENVYFKVTLQEMPSQTETEITVYINVLNNYDRTRRIFLSKLSEVENRG